MLCTHRFTTGIAASALLLGSAAAHADGDHVDVEFGYFGGSSFTLDPFGEAPTMGTLFPQFQGNKVYEAPFGDFAFGDFETDDPGFLLFDPTIEIEDEDTGTSTPTSSFPELAGLLQLPSGYSTVDYMVTSELFKYDIGLGSWQIAGFDESITIEDSTGLITTVDETSITNGSGVALDFVTDEEGPGHNHLPFVISGDGGDPEDGAYMFALKLFSEASGMPTIFSDEFMLVGHVEAGGLFEEEAFEGVVDGLTAVPVPAAVYLFGTGLVGLGALRRRRAIEV